MIPTPSQLPNTTEGDTLFCCPRCQHEAVYFLRNVLLSVWPVCPKCQDVPTSMNIVSTKTTVAAAYNEAVAPIIEHVGEALRELNRDNKPV